MAKEIDYTILPEHCRDGMRRYIENGIIPGSFLQAVICNDLVEAYGQADTINTMFMRNYARFLYNEAPKMPISSWGSKEIMITWHEKGGLNGILNEPVEGD